MAKFRKGQRVKLSREALENYGDKYTGIVFIIDSVSTKYMPAKEFYARDMPDGYHPGYDEAAGGAGLYDLITTDGDEIGFSVYDWELKAAPKEN